MTPTPVGPTEEMSIMTGTAKTTKTTKTTKTATNTTATKTTTPRAATSPTSAGNETSASFDTVADKLAGLARDAAYVLIGAGVLTVQQLQVRRRELIGTIGENPVVKQVGAIQLPSQLSAQVPTKQLEDVVHRLESGLGQLDERFEAIEAKLDAAVAAIEDRLPEQAGQLLGQAHDAAKAARKQVLGLIRNAA